jgi:amino acid permease
MANKKLKVNGPRSFVLIYDSVIALIYMALAFILLSGMLTDRFTESFNQLRLPLGIIMAVYGLFKVYTAVRKFKSANDERD